MSFWGTIQYRLKELIKSMIGSRTIEQTLHVAPVISSQMEEAIQLWADMYKGQAPWLKEPTAADPTRIVSLGLPSLIASEKARMALIELNSEITTPTVEVEVANPDFIPPEESEENEGVDITGNILPDLTPPTITEDQPISDTARAQFMNEQYEKLKKQIRTQFEYGIAKGGLVIKPYVIISDPIKTVTNDASAVKNDSSVDEQALEKPNAEIEFDFIQADSFYPLAFDNAGKITEAAFLQTKTEKDTVYRRLEYHKYENNTVQVVNKAFKSTNNTNDGDMSGVDLGQEIPLSDVPEWKDLQDVTTIANVDGPLFAYFKMPEANTIDTSSPLGVSGYSRAVSLIKDADMQYSRLLWEYEAGEMAIDIDRDALNFIEGGVDRDGHKQAGHSTLGKLQQRLYRKVDLGESDTFIPHAPALRDTAYLQGLNSILMRIEDVTGLSRGTISDAAAEARTATELKILKQRSYQANVDIQKSMQDCLEQVIYIMNVYCNLYDITAPGEYDVSFEWDDSIIVDVDTELGKRLTLMQNGLASKLENRMWYFGETKRQAEEALQLINQESLESMEQNIANQMQLGVAADDIRSNISQDKKDNEKDIKDQIKQDEEKQANKGGGNNGQ